MNGALMQPKMDTRDIIDLSCPATSRRCMALLTGGTKYGTESFFTILAICPTTSIKKPTLHPPTIGCNQGRRSWTLSWRLAP